MTNIGCVIYKKGKVPGTLNAKWCHSSFEEGISGTGKATGGPEKGYIGRYRIRYFDDKENEIAHLELNIEKTGEYYELVWIDKGKVVDIGIGMETPDGLVAGWKRVEDKTDP